MSKKSERARSDDGSSDQGTFEQALAQVEAIIDRIEAGEIGLEQSLVEYERGVGLINHCRRTLDRANQQIEDLTRRLESADQQDVEDGTQGVREPGAGPES